MLIYHVTYRMKPGKTEDFLALVKELQIAEKTRQEEGNQEYRYFLPAQKGEEEEVFLVERWMKESFQQQHLTTPHMEIFKGKKDEYVVETQVLIYGEK